MIQIVLVDDFRFSGYAWPEVKALLGFPVPTERISQKSIILNLDITDPYVAEGVRRLQSHAMFIYAVVDVFALTDNFENLVASFQDISVRDCVRQKIDKALKKTGDYAFKWLVKSHGKKISLADKRSMMEKMELLFQDHQIVDLRQDSVTLSLFTELTEDGNSLASLGECLFYVGKNEREYCAYTLEKRCVLGPTSLDARLAFALRNISNAKAYETVLDPFCGTGSILIPFAKSGCTTIAADYDLRVLTGWKLTYAKQGGVQNTSIFTNFIAYGLNVVDAICCKVSDLVYRAESIDHIVTDPPYGLRAAAGECGDEEMREKLLSLYMFLERLAHHCLKTGGSLIFYVPTGKSHYPKLEQIAEIFTTHFALCHEAILERFTPRSGRYCLCYRKK